MADIRKGDVLEFADGHAEVLHVVANNEGGLDISLRYAEDKKDLSRTVYRKGGPDEREDDEAFEEPADDLRAAGAFEPQPQLPSEEDEAVEDDEDE